MRIMSKTNDYEADGLRHAFNNDDIANFGDVSGVLGSSTDGSIYVALFTGDPGEAASFANEATYTGYARIAVARTTGGWTVTGTAPTRAENFGDIDFAVCTSGTETITHVAACKTLAGTATGEMLYFGLVDASVDVVVGVAPQFLAGTLFFTED